MELEFQQKMTNYLKKTLSQVQNQEETLETVIPDSMPDAQRILGCWGNPVIRCREWRTGGMTLSGGVEARVLYDPGEEGTPQLLEMYLPFSLSWEQDMGPEEGPMIHDCRIRGMDARIVNSRKILVRVNLTAKGEAFCRAQEPLFSLAEPVEGLELLRERFSVVLPAEIQEKTFLVDEDLELPATCPEMEKLLRVSAQPELTDQKVLGGKGVFKGFLLLHMLYLSREGKLCTWDFDVPMSQFAELERIYDNEEELQVTLLLSTLELTAEEDGRRLRLRCSYIAQCQVIARTEIEALKDAYSLSREAVPAFRDLELPSRLDRQSLRCHGEFSMPIPAGVLIDGAFYPEFPRTVRSEETVRLEVPFTAAVLYQDESGKLQLRSGSGTASCETTLAEGCRAEAQAAASGSPQWAQGGGSCILRESLNVTVDSYGQNGAQVLCGLEMGETRKPDPDRPAVILRRPGREEDLWAVAKAFGSTRSAIEKANHLEGKPLDPDMMLLIPVV